MSMSNGVFKGNICGSTLYDYSNKLDYSIKSLDRRIDVVNKVLNLDDIGSKDEFWQEIWDMATCKVGLNKDDALWSETNVSCLLESMGTYLLAKDDEELLREKRRFSRPKKEVEISGEYSSEDYGVAKNDKNYRLAPPDKIKESDYRVRNIFSKDYSYYKDELYPAYISKLKSKISEDIINRYGYHDGSFDSFSHSKLMEEETWNNLKRLELEKVEFLKDARHNLNILKDQNKKIKEGSLYFRPYQKEDKIKSADIYKYDFINRITPCHKQLERSGYDNKEIKLIEEKYLYIKRNRSMGVGLRHITNNLSDMHDYMLTCKLAYTNRVCIKPDKNSVNMNILEHVDYSNDKHIESILQLQGNEISYENDMSIISYDLNKAINILKKQKILDNKDIYIIESIRHKITHEDIAKELDISRMTVHRRLNKIIKEIKSFI